MKKGSIAILAEYKPSLSHFPRFPLTSNLPEQYHGLKVIYLARRR